MTTDQDVLYNKLVTQGVSRKTRRWQRELQPLLDEEADFMIGLLKQLEITLSEDYPDQEFNLMTELLTHYPEWYAKATCIEIALNALSESHDYDEIPTHQLNLEEKLTDHLATSKIGGRDGLVRALWRTIKARLTLHGNLGDFWVTDEPSFRDPWSSYHDQRHPYSGARLFTREMEQFGRHGDGTNAWNYVYTRDESKIHDNLIAEYDYNNNITEDRGLFSIHGEDIGDQPLNDLLEDIESETLDDILTAVHTDDNIFYYSKKPEQVNYLLLLKLIDKGKIKYLPEKHLTTFKPGVNYQYLTEIINSLGEAGELDSGWLNKGADITQRMGKCFYRELFFPEWYELKADKGKQDKLILERVFHKGGECVGDFFDTDFFNTGQRLIAAKVVDKCLLEGKKHYNKEHYKNSDRFREVFIKCLENDSDYQVLKELPDRWVKGKVEKAFNKYII